VYFLLHLVFPAGALDAFVRNSMTAGQTRRHYREKWDAARGFEVEERGAIQTINSPVDPPKS